MSSSDKKDEPTFGILPHPAKDNEPPTSGGGLNDGKFAGAAGAHHAREPHILSEDTAKGLDEPLSREQLKERAEALNK